MECLPPPPRLVISDKDTSSNPQNLLRVEAALNKAQEESRLYYKLDQPLVKLQCATYMYMYILVPTEHHHTAEFIQGHKFN